ncbi:hypothetical protein SLE2022_021270 [Rubroshorea leprosula]
MVAESIETHPTPRSQPKRQVAQPLDNANGRTKTKRHPRQTRLETIVLIQGKNAIESQAQSTSAYGSEQNEPKWDSVSSYCKWHGVDREPVQCRKRWSNIICDYNKIKTWELQIKEEADSFWVMGNGSLKRERKLPGFFDREVYDALDRRKFAMTAIPLAHITATTEMGSDDEKEATTEEHETQDEPGQESEKETIETSMTIKKTVNNLFPISDKVKEKHPTLSEWTRSMTQKRLELSRSTLDGCEDGRLDPLIKVLKRNGNPLNEQIQAQNTNCQLDRDQRKEHSESLVAAINKLTDALVRIADRL